MGKINEKQFDIELVEFNKYIAEGLSPTAAESRMGYGKGTFWSRVRTRCTKNPTTGIFERINPTSVRQPSESLENIQSDIHPTLVTQPNSIILEVHNDQLTSNLISLGGRYEEINEMLEWFKNKESDNCLTEVIQVIDEGIKIELPEDKTQKKISVWTNQEVWTLFGEFCDEHSEFTKGDLLSMALISYMQQHK